MIIEKAIENQIKSESGLVTLIGNRIYPDTVPETEKNYPVLVYQLISSVDDHALSDDPDSREERWQFSILAKTPYSRSQVDKELSDAFRDFTGTLGGVGGVTVGSIQQVNRSDTYYNETGIYERIIDFMFIYDNT